MPNNVNPFLYHYQSYFGIINGSPVYEITLGNGEMVVTITNLGCAITAIYTKDKNGVLANIVAGYGNLAPYADNPYYMGCVLGRYAGRIGGGIFTLDGVAIQLSQNDGKHHLHGGTQGLSREVWQVAASIQTDKNIGVVLEHISKHGTDGYPGNLKVQVAYLLDMDNELSIEYHATTDKKTPANFSNHSYFNLTGFKVSNVLDHSLHINATHYAVKDADNITTGQILPLKNTPLDFSSATKIGTHINAFPLDMGFNESYLITEKDVSGKLVKAAVVKEPQTHRTLIVYTDRPSVQLYTANYWDGSIIGSQGIPYKQHGALALETQALPNSPNHPLFPDTMLHPNNPYFSKTIYAFGLY